VEKTTLYLPLDLQQALRNHAERSRRPQAEVIREALRSYLDGLGPVRPSSIGMGADGELAARESEQWLAREWDRRLDHA
jgi:hypothetical protein